MSDKEQQISRLIDGVLSTLTDDQKKERRPFVEASTLFWNWSAEIGHEYSGNEFKEMFNALVDYEIDRRHKKNK